MHSIITMWRTPRSLTAAFDSVALTLAEFMHGQGTLLAGTGWFRLTAWQPVATGTARESSLWH